MFAHCRFYVIVLKGCKQRRPLTKVYLSSSSRGSVDKNWATSDTDSLPVRVTLIRCSQEWQEGVEFRIRFQKKIVLTS